MIQELSSFTTGTARLRVLVVAILATVLITAEPVAAQGGWNWSGSYDDDAVELLILGDIQVFRENPTTAFVHVQETLHNADLVYANYEGALVRSKCTGCLEQRRRRAPGEGKTIDIPGKDNWVHPGPKGVLGLSQSWDSQTMWFMESITSLKPCAFSTPMEFSMPGLG